MGDDPAQDGEGSRRELIAILPSTDAVKLHEIVAQAGFRCRIAAPEEIAAGIRSGELGLAIVGPAALGGERASSLTAAVKEQPPWSDFPFLLLAERDAVRRQARAVEELRCVTLVERPLDALLLLTGVKAALLARKRQRESGKNARDRAELKRMEAELIEVSRLSAMGAMASTLAHELNQPLTAVASYVRGALRLLESDGGPAAPEVRAALEAAEQGAVKAGQIVRGLREMVSRRSPRTRSQDIAAIIEEASVLAFVDEQAQGVTHKVEVDPAARWVEADRVQVQQVLINLVRNSIEAMAGRQRREIVIATRPAADHMVEVSVTDSGEGLLPEARGALFSPFTSNKREGMGIGLSISRTIVEAHGGRIWADDAPEEGTVFRFTLPEAHEAPPAKQIPKPSAKA